MKADLLCMIDRFPGSREKIVALFEESEDFRLLCHDYYLCVSSLNHWLNNREKDQQVIDEYSTLRSGLEEELLDLIDKVSDSSGKA